ncbi:MAG: serine hydrolase domain-containing protein [Ferruginibacter sp.]
MNQTFCSVLSIVASHSCTFYRYAALSLIIVFTSCNFTAKSNNDTAKTDTTKMFLPVPGVLPKQTFQRLHHAVEGWYDSALRSKSFNGGIVVAKNGQIVFEDYNGNAHVGGTDAITDSTSFHIASVSKTFTAMAVLKLWQEGKFSIDDEYSKFFPQFNYPGLTIRNLLSHRSGLPNYLYFMEDLGWDKKTFITNQDVLDYLINRKSELTNISSPGTHFAYCNTNYALLALLVEKISGKKFGDYLHDNFFGPLQMKHTFVYSSKDSATAIPSYDYRGRIIPMNFLDHVYGDKNVYSTPRDLLAWDQALTHGVLFNEKTLAEAYAPYSNEKPGIRNYGLGWRMNNYPTGKKMIYHNGWWHGNNASFIRLVQDSATIIVLGNKYDRGIYHANRLADIFGNYLGSKEEDEPENNEKQEGETSTVAPKKKTVLKHAK